MAAAFAHRLYGVSIFIFVWQHFVKDLLGCAQKCSAKRDSTVANYYVTWIIFINKPMRTIIV